MTKKTDWKPTLKEALNSVKIGTKEEAFLGEELRTNEKSKEGLLKAIEAIDWMKPIIEKRIEDIKKET